MSANFSDPLSEITSPTPTRTPFARPPVDYDSLIQKHAARTGLDPDFVRRVVGQESRGNPNAVSPKGASGLMQLMPDTARSLGVKKINDPEENIRGGTDYLKQHLDEFGSPDLALAAYNSGPGNVRKYGKVPPFAETQNYVKKILQGYQGTGLAQDPLSEITGQDTDPLSQVTAPDVPAPNRTRQAKPYAPQGPQITSNDAAWHLGANPDEAKRLGPKAYRVLQDAVAEDQRKKAAGQEIQPPSLEYQNQMRAKAGLKPTTAFAGVTGSAGGTDPIREKANRMMAEQGLTPDKLAEKRREAIAMDNPILQASGLSRFSKETSAQGAAGVLDMVAGIGKLAAKGRAPGAQAGVDYLQNQAAGLRQMAGEAEEQRPMGKVAQVASGVGAGLLEFAPLTLIPELGLESVLAKIGAAAATGGAYTGVQAVGRNESAGQVAKDSAVGAATFGLLGVPLPGKNIVKKALANVLITGGGTTAINMASGQPFSDAATQGLVMTLMRSPDLLAHIKVKEGETTRTATQADLADWVKRITPQQAAQGQQLQTDRLVSHSQLKKNVADARSAVDRHLATTVKLGFDSPEGQKANEKYWDELIPAVIKANAELYFAKGGKYYPPENQEYEFGATPIDEIEGKQYSEKHPELAQKYGAAPQPQPETGLNPPEKGLSQVGTTTPGLTNAVPDVAQLNPPGRVDLEARPVETTESGYRAALERIKQARAKTEPVSDTQNVPETVQPKPQEQTSSANVGVNDVKEPVTRSREDVLREFAKHTTEGLKSGFTPELVERVSELRQEGFKRFGMTDMDAQAREHMPVRPEAEIQRDINKLQKSMERMRDNYKAPLSGGTRKQTTTFNANMGRTAESLAAYREELAYSRERAAKVSTAPLDPLSEVTAPIASSSGPIPVKSGDLVYRTVAQPKYSANQQGRDAHIVEFGRVDDKGRVVPSVGSGNVPVEHNGKRHWWHVDDPNGPAISDRSFKDAGDGLKVAKERKYGGAGDIEAGLSALRRRSPAQPVAPIAAPNLSEVPKQYAMRTPIRGANGNEIVGYNWKSRLGEKYSEYEGGLVPARVSDWDDPSQSTGTGRKIVHEYYVKHPDGTVTIEGVRSAQNILGITESRLQTIAKNERAARETQAKHEADWVKSIESRAYDSPAEAAQAWRKTNYTPLQSFETLNKAFNETIPLEKDGKFLRALGDNARLLQEHGWKEVGSAPVAESAVDAKTQAKIDKLAKANNRKPRVMRVDTENHSISQAVRQLGGIRPDNINVDAGELRRLMPKESGTTGLVNKKSKYTAERMIVALREHGYIGEGENLKPSDLLAMIEDDVKGNKRYSTERTADFKAELSKYDAEAEQFAKNQEAFRADEKAASLFDKLLYNGTEALSPGELNELYQKAEQYGISAEVRRAVEDHAGIGDAAEFTGGDDSFDFGENQTPTSRADSVPQPTQEPQRPTLESLRRPDNGLLGFNDDSLTLTPDNPAPDAKAIQQQTLIDAENQRQRDSVINVVGPGAAARIERFRESKNSTIKRAADRLWDGVRNGTHNEKAAGQLLSNIDKLAGIQARGMTVDDYLKTPDLFGEQATPEQAAALKQMENQGRKPLKNLSDAENAKLAAAKNRLNRNLDPSTSHDVADVLRLLPDAAIIAKYHVINGARGFAEFSKRMIDDVGDWVEPHLRELYGKAGGKETEEVKTETKAPVVETKTAKGETVAPVSETPHHSELQPRTEEGKFDGPPVEPTAEAAKPERITSVKNATVKAERALRGLDDVERELPRSDKDIWAKARHDVESGLVDADKLAADVVRKHRALDEDETVQLLVRRTQLDNQREELMKAAEEAVAKGDKAKAAEYNLKVEDTERLLKLNDEADTHSGTKQARAFRIRQLMAKEDFSLAAMERRRTVARGGELTATDKAEIKELHSQIAKLNAEKEKMAADHEAALTEQATRKLIRDERFKSRGVRRTTSRKVLDDDFDALKKQLAAVWKKPSSPGIHPMGLAALDPEGVATKIVLKMARNRIQANFITAEALIDEVHKGVSDTVDLTKRQVAEMISGYGKTSKPSEDPIEVKLNELKSIIASNLGTADILEKGIRPERRGFQRPKPTQEMRDAARKMRDALKANGMEVEKSKGSEEAQQKSVMDAAKTRTRNRIEDLTKWIADGKRTVANKTEIIPDEELKGLRTERDTLQKVFDAIKDPEADQKTIENAIHAANKSISDLQAKIQSGDIQPVKGEKGPTSPELEAARTQQRILREVLNDMRTADRKANAAPPDSFEVEARKLLSAHKALNTRLEKQAAEYQRRIDQVKATGRPYEPPPKKDPFARTSAERLIEERVGRLKQQFEAENRKASLTPMDWVARLIVGTGRAAKLTYVGTLGKLTSAATGRIVISPGEDLVGHGVGKIFPELYKGAAAEGPGSTPEAAKVANDLYKGPTGEGLLKDHIAGIERLWKSDTWRQAIAKLTTGQSQQDVLFGKEAHETDFLGIPGQVHGTFKEPVRQSTFYRQFRRRLGQIAREGKQDISDPQVQMGAATEAWNDAARSIFMQRNFLSDGFNSMIAGWERTGKAGPKTMAMLARLEFPITRVPVNVASEGLNYTFGIGRALGETGYRTLVGGGKGERFSLNESFKKMTPEQKDSLMRAYKKGGLGLAMVLWGYLQPHHFGGFFQKGDKRDKDEPGFDEMMFFGFRIPAWATHIPIFFAAQMGATFRRIHDAGKEKGNPDAGIEALGATAKGVVSHIPFYETPGRFFSGMEGPRQASRFAGEQVRGFIPGFAQEWAKKQDKNPDTDHPNVRTPEGTFMQRAAGTVKLGVPDTPFSRSYSRQTVPINEKIERADEKQSAIDQMRGGTIPDEAELKAKGFTPAQIKAMQKDAKLTDFQVAFSNAPADKSLDRFERMDANQRSQVQEAMEKKAFALKSRAEYLLDNAKDADKQKRQDELNTLQQRLDSLGIEPRNPNVRQSSPFKTSGSGFRAPGFR